MRRIVMAIALAAGAAFTVALPARADNVHMVTNTSGQPDAGGSQVNCGSNGLVSNPGNANQTNNGSPFSPNGIAGTKYAGSQPQNSNNPKSISQYDVACFQATMHQSH
jgi:hypothetical protein